MVEIQVNSQLSFLPDNEKISTLTKAAFTTLDLREDSTAYGIHITTSEEIQSLNAQYRGFDRPTDVLSFEADIYDPEQNVTYMGDIIISLPIIQEQAKQAGHPEETELLLLITHGLLHLAGYDHATDEEKTKMWALQTTILNSIGIFPLKFPED